MIESLHLYYINERETIEKEIRGINELMAGDIPESRKIIAQQMLEKKAQRLESIQGILNTFGNGGI